MSIVINAYNIVGDFSESGKGENVVFAAGRSGLSKVGFGYIGLSALASKVYHVAVTKVFSAIGSVKYFRNWASKKAAYHDACANAYGQLAHLCGLRVGALYVVPNMAASGIVSTVKYAWNSVMEKATGFAAVHGPKKWNVTFLAKNMEYQDRTANAKEDMNGYFQAVKNVNWYQPVQA